MTSVLTRDPELRTAQVPVLVPRAAWTRSHTGTTEPAAARRGSTVEAWRTVAVASPPIDVVDQWGMQSFPASDPPSNR